MTHQPPTKPEPVQLVAVWRHRVDWEDSDLAEVTAQRAVALATRIATGCWYLNPRYTVSSADPSAEFFRAVLDLRCTWLHTCRQVLGNSGQRHLARQVEARGRRGALLDPNPDGPTGEAGRLVDMSVVRSSIPRDRRRDVIEAGQMAKSLAFGGVMFIDGQPIPPPAWQAKADDLLNGRHGQGIIQNHRRLPALSSGAGSRQRPLAERETGVNSGN